MPKRKTELGSAEPVIPKHLTWLTGILTFAYRDRRFVLSMIGDIAKLMRKRRADPKTSNTLCIACGGWISEVREKKGQHTCSEPCQRWYRRLMRAWLAERFCRYCSRPKSHPKTVHLRRPAKPIQKVSGSHREDRLRAPGPVKVESIPRKKGNAAGTAPGVQGSLPLVRPRIGQSVSIVPDAKRGVSLGGLQEALENLQEGENRHGKSQSASSVLPGNYGPREGLGSASHSTAKTP